MLQLAVRGGETLLPLLERRVSGAAIVPFPPGGAPPEASRAVAFLDSGADDAALINRSLKTGKHTLLVAQPWLTARVLDGLADEAARSGAHLVVLNPDRFLPSRQLIRQQLDSGRLGEPGLVRSHRWEHAPAAADAARPPVASGDIPSPVAREIDVALWLIGEPPNLVYALASGGSLHVHLGFPGGGMALLDYVDRLPPGDGYRSLSMIGSTGAAYADDHQNVQLVYRGGHPSAVTGGDGGRELVALVQHFVSRLDQPSGQSASDGVADWRAATSVARAALASAAGGRAIPPERS